MSGDTIEVKTGPPVTDPSADHLLDRITLIFSTGFSEIRRKGTVTRLHFEIKGFEKEKEKHIQALGVRAWEAHVKHPDLAAILVHLKELQIEMNRLKTQFGEHDTQIQDIEASKTGITLRFNENLDLLDKQIVPHRQRIETIHAEKEDNKVQMEELRSQQDHLSQQIRIHQQKIQELDLADDAEKSSKIQLEQESIRKVHLEKCEIDCKFPFLQSHLEKLKIALAGERAEIEKVEEAKEDAKRDFEQHIKDCNHQIHELEEKKKLAWRQMEQYRREMEPFLYELGKKVEQLRLEESNFRENYDQLDHFNKEVEKRRKHIAEAASLSRAMDRAAWTQFLVFSGSVFLVFLSVVFILLH